MVEIIVYNVLFWGLLVGVTKVLESSMQYAIDNHKELNKKG